jgi:G:T-mismatch repair DNA endonuclease (very short patch repair protein)
LDATDLALSKLERNVERDREDFLRLVRAGFVNLQVFRTRYLDEVRPYMLGNIPWHDKTLELWLKIAAG